MPLCIRSPFAGVVSLAFGSGPQANGVDASIWLSAGRVNRRRRESTGGMPGHFPVPDSLLDCVDNLGRDLRVHVRSFDSGILVGRH